MFNTNAFRKSVLNQAMQGELTQQLSEDGSVNDLLQSIAKQKRNLIKAGKINRTKKLGTITDDEIPFKVPDNWKWVRLNNISLWQSGGYTPKKSDPKNYNGNLLWLRSGDLNNNYIYNTKDKISTYALKNHSLRLVPKNSIIMARVGGITIAKLGIVTQKATYNDQCFSCIPYINNVKFIFYYLMSQKHNLENLSAGGVQSSLPISKVRNYLIPLPPLAEQKRIVKNIDECFKLADLIDQEQQLTKNFDDDMYKSLLQSAMQGKLTQQLPEDGDASDLLQSIIKKKQRLYKAGKIKKPKQLAAITDDEIPFKIPDNWKWVRLEYISNKITDGTHNPPKNSFKGIPILSAKNITSSGIDFSLSNRYLTQKQFEKEDQRTKIRKDDILLSIVGSIGKVCIVNNTHNFTVQRSICIIKTNIYNKFLAYYLESPFAFSYYKENGKGTAQRGVYLKQIRNMIIPIPPLSEQKCIVNKLDSLFSKIDKI